MDAARPSRRLQGEARMRTAHFVVRFTEAVRVGTNGPQGSCRRMRHAEAAPPDVTRPRRRKRTAATARRQDAAKPDARRAALEGCCASGVEFRDAFAAIVGRDDLDGHVAASQAFSRGVALESHGAISACHDHVKFGWKAVMNGETVATGANVGRLDLEGRFLSVHGFRD